MVFSIESDGEMITTQGLPGVDLWMVTGPSGPSVPVVVTDWVDVPFNANRPLPLFFKTQNIQDTK